MLPDRAPAISVRSVSFDYGSRDGSLPSGHASLLSDVSFSVGNGECVALLGPSGCGKSTLLRIIAQLQRPDRGDVHLNTRANRLPCAMMFQELFLFYWRCAQKNVELVLRARGVGRREASAEARRCLQLVGLGESGELYPHELSGGMQQRLAIARILATDAPTFLLDEPFTALDQANERALEHEFLTVCQQRNVSSLLVTHDVRKALRMADRIILLSTKPATVRAELQVPLPRPRHGMIEFSSEFLSMEKSLCEMINPL